MKFQDASESLFSDKYNTTTNIIQRIINIRNYLFRRFIKRLYISWKDQYRSYKKFIYRFFPNYVQNP